MTLVIPQTSNGRLLPRSRPRLNGTADIRSAVRSIPIWLFLLTVSLGSSAIAQSRNRAGNSMMMRQYMNQYNKMNEQQRKDSAAEAKNVIQKSGEEIKKLEARLTKLNGEIEEASGQVDKYTKSFGQCESDLRKSRKDREDREEKILASQEPSSKYQLIVERLKDAEKESSRQIERVLGRAVKEAEPEKLRLTLNKPEFKSLEDDKECAAAFKQLRAAKGEKTEEIKRLLALDAAIEKLDSLISKDFENRKILKAQLSDAKAKKKRLTNEKNSITSSLESAKNDRDAAERYLATATGKVGR